MKGKKKKTGATRNTLKKLINYFFPIELFLVFFMFPKFGMS